MSKIAIGGFLIIPLGLAASTISSALGSVLVAPRTLQALASDKSIPFRKFNYLMAKGKGKSREPFNASILTFAIAFLRSEEHTSELQSRPHLVCRLLLEKKNNNVFHITNI